MDAAELRAQFPVFERVAYLNAGTCGPLPAAARRALDDAFGLGEVEGRRKAYYDRHLALLDRRREAYAGLLGARAEDVAVTTSTSEGVGRVLSGLELAAGDEILTSDAEHPGLLGPLLGAKARHGVAIRTAPLADLANHVTPRTKLIACSHVGWVTGDVAPPLAATGVPVLLDGAQGIGAVPVDVDELGCAFYAGSGQKWLCGPVGTGMLYVAPEWQTRLKPLTFAYGSYADSSRALEPEALHDGARRFDTAAMNPELAAAALASLDVLAGFGWDNVHDRARTLARELATRLADGGRAVGPRGETTLVSWEDQDPEATAARLTEQGIAVRFIPGTPYLRASVGAWNDEDDLARLLAAL
ncbi:MAG TPA: aminotransferase class V-fold PLP-dependent enzyme [Solirubrobacteraceae bacterium]